MPAQTIRLVEGKERNRISISQEDVFDDKGQLKLHPFTSGKGYVELKHTPTGLELEVKGVVGHLPISNNLTLNIQPKFPVSNLSRMVAMSDELLHSTAPLEREYLLNDKSDFLPEAQIRAFAHYLSELLKEGLEKKYLPKTVEGLPRPKINLGQSQQRYWSRGISHIAISDQFDLTSNISVNQVLKSAIIAAYSLISKMRGFDQEQSILIETLSCLERVNERFPTNLLTHLEYYISQVASYRPAYKKALPIAVEILKRSTVSFSHSGAGIKMPSFLLVLDNIFESYIRNVLRPHLWKKHQHKVQDGNKAKWQTRLFDKSAYKIKPDLLVFDTHKQPVLIGDMKYKKAPKEEDRYQLLSHTIAYKANRAILIYPKNGEKVGLHHLGAVGPDQYRVDMYNYFIDLSNDLAQEEMDLCSAVTQLIP